MYSHDVSSSSSYSGIRRASDLVNGLKIDEVVEDIPPPIKERPKRIELNQEGAPFMKAYLAARPELKRVSFDTFLKVEDNQFGSEMYIHNIYYNPKKKDISDFAVKVKLYNMENFVSAVLDMWRQKEPARAVNYVQSLF